MKYLMHKSYSVLVSSRLFVNGLAYRIENLFIYCTKCIRNDYIQYRQQKSYCYGVLIFIESLQIYATNLRHFFVILNPITRTILF